MILIKSWRDAEKEAFSVRKHVFIEEQGVPEELELDEYDPVAWHALAYLDSQCIGTARLVIFSQTDGGIGRIGRMAVLPKYRKQGHGKSLLQALLEKGKAKGISQFELHAQLSAIPFYEQFGFIADGPIYDEAGIEHRDMILNI
jgi:predicted GNAT family N-acyltransferase